MENILFRNVGSNDVDRVIEIERECFSPEECGDVQWLRDRQAHAPDLFLGAYLVKSPEDHELVGFVCSSLNPSQTLTLDSMANHVPGSSSICLYSVNIAPAHRRKGIASALMREYISRISAAGLYDRILLITHEELRSFYESLGFEFVGQSSVELGSRPWYEMRKILPRSVDESICTSVSIPVVPTDCGHTGHVQTN